MTNLDAEERAFDLLQWVPYSLPSEYDEEEAMCGKYTAMQQQRSDAALDEWDLKTVSSKRSLSQRAPATAQLGAYTQLLGNSKPEINVGLCVTIISAPGRIKIVKQDPEECLEAWQQAWDRFSAELPDF